MDPRRKPSRLMPPASRVRAPFHVWVVGSLLLAGLVAGLAYLLWTHPLAVGGTFLVLLAVGLFTGRRETRRLRRLAEARQPWDIGAFARQFDLRAVDTWVVRAVYEELQDELRPVVAAFPLRAEDRLSDDLGIDMEDLEDLIGPAISSRTGRSDAEVESNPFCGRVRTVGDLVMFFNAQPGSAGDVDGAEGPGQERVEPRGGGAD